MKGKKLLTLLLLVGTVIFAAETEFVQYTTGDYGSYNTPGQNWPDAKMITLKVSAGSTVYLVSKTRSWYEDIPDLADETYIDGEGHVQDHLAGFDMSENKYGYVFAQIDDAGKASPDGGIHLADGSTKKLTITDGTHTRPATGYLLGTFTDNAEIFLVMTPYGFDSTIDTYNPVSTDPNEALQGRHVNYEDLTKESVVNLGTINGIGHEFIIGYVAEPPTPPATSGQPLPGVLTSCLVGLCATGIAARRRKQSRK